MSLFVITLPSAPILSACAMGQFRALSYSCMSGTPFGSVARVGIGRGRVNPMGCWVGYSGVGVRVDKCPPCKDPHPSLGYPGYPGIGLLDGTCEYMPQIGLLRIGLLRVSDVQSSHMPGQPSHIAPSSHPSPSRRSHFPPLLSTDQTLSPSSQRHVACCTPILMAEDMRIAHIASADVKAQKFHHSMYHPSHTAPR